MIDAHCHIDAYPDPYHTALDADRAGVLTIAVTNLPSAFEAAYPHVRPLRNLRLAVGLHPLFAEQHAAEREQFLRCLQRTNYVGEIGLDFSREGVSTRDLQIASFRFVLESVRKQPKYLSIHSRHAEGVALDLLEEFGTGPVVFHWYSGSLTDLERLLAQGHFCSINPAMLRNARGRVIIERVPPERALTETDGPYVSIGSQPVYPKDVAVVEQFLAQLWGWKVDEVRRHLRRNFGHVVPGMMPASYGATAGPV